MHSLQIAYSRPQQGDIDLLRQNVRLDIVFMAYKLFFEKEFHKMGCNYRSGVSTKISSTVAEVYVNGSGCGQIDYEQLINDVHDYSEHIDEDAVIDELKVARSSVTILRSSLTIKSIEVKVVREDYPQECYNNDRLRCMSKAFPQCDLPCGPLASCDPAEAAKYCTEYEGCVLAPEQVRPMIQSDYWCGNSASGVFSIVAIVSVFILNTVAIMM